MSDLDKAIERLRSASFLEGGDPEFDGADPVEDVKLVLLELASLRAQLAQSEANHGQAVSYLQDQLASARKALEPFAKIAPLVEFTDKRDGEIVHRQLDKDGRPHELTKDDFRKVASAYTDE